MHHEAEQYIIGQVKTLDTQGKRVVEFGGRNINGSIRNLFVGSEYQALDSVAGPGVDIVMDAGVFDGLGEYDIVVSTECLEHAPKPKSIIDSAYRALKLGGVFLATAAAEPRLPHGQEGGPHPLPGEWYENIVPDDLADWLHKAGFTDSEVEYNPDHGDVYARATK